MTAGNKLTGGTAILNDVKLVAGSTGSRQVAKTVYAGAVTGDADSHAVGDSFTSWANPEGVDIIITQAILDLTVAGTTGSVTGAIGVAANATTSANTLFATVALDAIGTTTSGALADRMTSTQYVTFDASGNTADMAGALYITYIIA